MGRSKQITQKWGKDKELIITAYLERKIATFFEAEDKNEQFKNLHKLLVKWAVLCGVKPLPTDDEIRLFVEYIAEHYYKLSLMEIDNAFHFATSGKLDCDPDHYQSFSVIYIAKLINAYREFVGKYILDYKNEMAELEAQAQKPTPEQQAEMMIETILEAFEGYKKERRFNDFGYISYDFLKGLGVLKIPDHAKKEILENARGYTMEYFQEKKKNASSQEDKISIGNIINEINNDKTGKEENVIRNCKNIGLMYFYDYLINNNLSLSDEIIKQMNNNEAENNSKLNKN